MVSMLPKKKKRLFVKNVKICKKEHSTESESIRKMFWKIFDFFTAFWAMDDCA